MMHGHEKSDPAIVAVKPANKAKKSTAEASAGKVAAEPGERRAGTKGNAGQQSTCRAQNRISVSQALERIRWTLCPRRHVQRLALTVRFKVQRYREGLPRRGRTRCMPAMRPTEVVGFSGSLISAPATVSKLSNG